MKILVVGRSDPSVGRDLSQYAEYVEQRCDVSCHAIECTTSALLGESPTPAQFVLAYSEIADRIDELLLSQTEFARSRIGILQYGPPVASDRSIVDDLVATDYTGWNNLLSLLIITYPDILWLTSTDAEGLRGMTSLGLGLHAFTNQNAVAQLRQARDLVHAGFEPVFDPTGLRALVKQNSFRKLEDGSDKFARRRAMAAVIDHGVDVARAVSYAHYKSGHRVLNISTESLLWMYVSTMKTGMLPPSEYLTEGSTLAFPDAADRGIYDDPFKRPKSWRLLFANLSPRDRRVLQLSEGSPLAGQKTFTPEIAPFDGLTGLIDKLGLKDEKAGFHWPPPHAEAIRHRGRHAMRGFLVTAARRLIARLESDACREPYRRAIMAMEAQELLQNCDPPLSLRAHQARLDAEVRIEMSLPTLFGQAEMFDGAGLRRRFDEIRGECDSILSVIYTTTARRKRRMRGLLETQMIGKLIDAYRSTYHFREEMICLQERRQIEMTGDFLGSYFALVLRRPRNFSICVTLWIVLFAILYYGCSEYVSWARGVAQLPTDRIIGALLHSAISFVTVGAAPDQIYTASLPVVANHPAYALILLLECAIGLLHWGIGLAHVAAYLSRR